MKLERLKSKFFFAFPILAFSLALSSCSEDEEAGVTKVVDKGQTVTFMANPLTTETREVSTRVSLNPAGSASGTDVLRWENNDRISFHFYDSENYLQFNSEFTVSVAEGGVADLTGNIPTTPGKYNIYAISPKFDDNDFFVGDQLGVSNLRIPQTQVQTSHRNTNHLKPYLYLHAKATDADGIVVRGVNDWSGDVSLDFSVKSSILRFDIDNLSSQDITLKEIMISYPTANTGILYSMNRLDEESGELIPVAAAKYESMTLDMSSVQLDNLDSYTGYMAVFPTGNSGILNIDLEIVDRDGNPVTIKYSTSAPALECSTRYSIYLDVSASDLFTINPDGSLNYELPNGNSYKIIQYPTGSGGSLEWWMLEDLRESGFSHNSRGHYYYTFDAAMAACPVGWSIPDASQSTRLMNHLNNYRLGSAFFANNSVKSGFYSYDLTLTLPTWEYIWTSKFFDPFNLGGTSEILGLSMSSQNIIYDDHVFNRQIAPDLVPARCVTPSIYL
jgi:hypothetical protein